MKKTFLFGIVCFICAIAHGQQVSNFVFDIKSKYDTKIEIDITVSYGGEMEYSLKDLIIRKIHSIVIDSLSKYDAIELYTVARKDIKRVLKTTYRHELNKKQIEFNEVVLNDIKIPEELRIIFEEQQKKRKNN